MNPQTILAIASLLDTAVRSLEALKAVSDMIKVKRAAGQEITLDDFKSLQVEDDAARDLLFEAIEEAENE